MGTGHSFPAQAITSSPTTLPLLPDAVLGKIYSLLDKPSRISFFHTCSSLHSCGAILGQMHTLLVHLTCIYHPDDHPVHPRPPSAATQLATLPKNVQPRTIIFQSQHIRYNFSMNYSLVLPQIEQACADEQARARLGSVAALSFKGPCMLLSAHVPQLAALLRTACPLLSSLSIPPGISFELVPALHASGARLEQLHVEVTEMSAPKFEVLSQLPTLRSLALVTYNLSGLDVLRPPNLTRLSITGLMWSRSPDGLQAVLDSCQLMELRIPSLPSKHSGQRLRSHTLRTLVLQYVDTEPAFKGFHEGLPRLKTVAVEDGFYLDPESADLDGFDAWNRLLASSGDEAAGMPHIECSSLTLGLCRTPLHKCMAMLPHSCPMPWVTGTLRLVHVVIFRGHVFGHGFSGTTNTYPHGLLPCSHLFPNVRKLELVLCPLDCTHPGHTTLEQAVRAFPYMRELHIIPFTWGQCEPPALFHSVLLACGEFQRGQHGHHLTVCVRCGDTDMADAEAASQQWEAELAGLGQPRRVSVIVKKNDQL